MTRLKEHVTEHELDDEEQEGNAPPSDTAEGGRPTVEEPVHAPHVVEGQEEMARPEPSVQLRGPTRGDTAIELASAAAERENHWTF